MARRRTKQHRPPLTRLLRHLRPLALHPTPSQMSRLLSAVALPLAPCLPMRQPRLQPLPRRPVKRSASLPLPPPLQSTSRARQGAVDAEGAGVGAGRQIAVAAALHRAPSLCPSPTVILTVTVTRIWEAPPGPPLILPAQPRPPLPLPSPWTRSPSSMPTPRRTQAHIMLNLAPPLNAPAAGGWSSWVPSSGTTTSCPLPRDAQAPPTGLPRLAAGVLWARDPRQADRSLRRQTVLMERWTRPLRQLGGLPAVLAAGSRLAKLQQAQCLAAPALPPALLMQPLRALPRGAGQARSQPLTRPLPLPQLPACCSHLLRRLGALPASAAPRPPPPSSRSPQPQALDRVHVSACANGLPRLLERPRLLQQPAATRSPTQQPRLLVRARPPLARVGQGPAQAQALVCLQWPLSRAQGALGPSIRPSAVVLCPVSSSRGLCLCAPAAAISSALPPLAPIAWPAAVRRQWTRTANSRAWS